MSHQSARWRRERLTLESVWGILESGQWESKDALKKASGVDDDTLTGIIGFLDRWQFIETKRTPELLVRRKSGVISPVETLQILRSINSETTETTSQKPNTIAERVACRRCGGRHLATIGHNEVECATCHEKQWFALEIDKTTMKLEEAEPRIRLGIWKRMLVRLGLPQPAFSRNVPRQLQYFWFRCTECSRVSADYLHGWSQYMTCEFCGSKSRF